MGQSKGYFVTEGIALGAGENQNVHCKFTKPHSGQYISHDKEGVGIYITQTIDFTR